jgi:general secretion pathway protein K
MRNKSGQNGVALVLVLWITVMLMIMAGAFSLTLQREAKLIGNLRAKSEVSAFAEAGLNYALVMMAIKDQEKSWKADGGMHELPFSDGLVTVKISDEAGKIDLNFARRELLVKMFISAGAELSMADKLADAVLDWRDVNDDVQMNGAEAKDYKQQNLTYGPRNAPFQSVEELQFVLGVPLRLYRAVEPLLTVYSGKADVDKTKAGAEVLKILEAMAAEGSDALGGNSAGETGSSASGTDGSEGVGESDSTDENDAGDGDGDGSGSSSQTAVSGTGVYTVDIAALIPSGHTGHIRAVVRPGGNGVAMYEVLSWKQVTAENLPLPPQNLSYVNNF